MNTAPVLYLLQSDAAPSDRDSIHLGWVTAAVVVFLLPRGVTCGTVAYVVLIVHDDIYKCQCTHQFIPLCPIIIYLTFAALRARTPRERCILKRLTPFASDF